MEQSKTYSQEQLNTVAQSYMDEIVRLQQINANHRLTILGLRSKVQELQKKITDLEIKKSEPKKK